MSLPRQIGRYQVRSILGTGAMGVVYHAHDPQLARDVAVKMIRLPGGLDSGRQELLTRSLLREARLAARLSHPGIIQVFDAGQHEGEPYVILELLTGEPLAALLGREGALAPERAVALLGEILDAMAYAHDQGIIHRDLKPANIMIQAGGRPRIMDFGIAHALNDPASGPQGLAGTPRYMAPEQIAGDFVDRRSDVFSLGLLFYELLAGRRAFPQSDLTELRRAVSEANVTPLQALRPDLPAPLCALAARALERDPGARFADARAMLEALRRALEEQNAPVPVKGPARKEIIGFILEKIARQGDFPSTMQYIEAITRATHNEHASAHAIAEVILKDFALTNRILRMVNSPFYRGAGGPISTISRAVVVLGVNTVQDVVAGLSLFEHFQNRSDLRELRELTIQALMTAIHAREIARELGDSHQEEAFICGMLHHLGRLIVAFYFPDEHQAIVRLVRQGAMDEAAAALKIMRVSYAELGQAVAQSWRLPEIVFRGIQGLDARHAGPLRTPEQALQGIVSYAFELSRATMITDEDRRRAALTSLAQRFEGQISLKPHQLARIIENSVRNAWDISHALRVNLKDLGLTNALLPESEGEATARSASAGEVSNPAAASPSQSLADPADETSTGDEEDLALGRQDFLMQTISEITMALTGPFQINDILMMVLEGMYRGIGFQHVLLALVSPARDQLACRFGLGERIDAIREEFKFPLTRLGHLPARCIQEAREFFIANLGQDAWRGAFPPPLLGLLDARGVVMLPIIVREVAIGLFFVDRAAGQPVLDKHDLLYLHALANQAILAISQSQSRK